MLETVSLAMVYDTNRLSRSFKMLLNQGLNITEENIWRYSLCETETIH